MTDKPTAEPGHVADAPYDPADAEAVKAFWDEATPHTGRDELRAKRGRPKKSAD